VVKRLTKAHEESASPIRKATIDFRRYKKKESDVKVVVQFKDSGRRQKFIIPWPEYFGEGEILYWKKLPAYIVSSYEREGDDLEYRYQTGSFISSIHPSLAQKLEKIIQSCLSKE